MIKLVKVERKDVIPKEKYLITIQDGDLLFWHTAYLMPKNEMYKYERPGFIWVWGTNDLLRHNDDDSVSIYLVK